MRESVLMRSFQTSDAPQTKFFRKMTAGKMSRGIFHQFRGLLTANWLSIITARVENTARWRVRRAGNFTLQADAVRAHIWIRRRDRGQKRFRIRMQWVVQKLVRLRHLYDLAYVHH